MILNCLGFLATVVHISVSCEHSSTPVETMVSDKVQFVGVAPPPYSESVQVQRSGWRRKRIWISTIAVVVLILFGVIFGAVYGVKKAHSE